MTLAEEVGDRLRMERARSRMPMQFLADRAGLSKSYVSDIERGVKNPTMDVLESLCGVLGIEVGALFIQHTARGLTDAQKLAAIRELASIR